MSNATEISTTDELNLVRTTFREAATNKLHDAANMTLHELVDEYVRLSDVIDADSYENSEHPYVRYGATAQLAIRNRLVILAASKARFGIMFSTYDRSSRDDGGF